MGTILLIEDSEADAELVRRSLSDEVRASVLVMRNAGDALGELRRAKHGGATIPTLVLLDLNLPGASGLEVLEEIKGDPELRTIPVVVLSSSQSESDVRNAYSKGANSYVAKPVDLAQFRDAVASIERFWLGTVRHARLP